MPARAALPRRALTAALALGGACGGDPARVELPAVTPPGEQPPPTPPTPPTPPAPRQLRLTILDVVPRTDTLRQLGFELAARIDTSVVRSAVAYVDSGTAGERRVVVKQAMPGSYDSDLLFGALFAPGAGRHRFTIVATDTSGRTVSASFERTFEIPDERYAATLLPDPGAGAGAAGISERGEVTGWVVGGTGRRRPAVWRGTTRTLLPAHDTVDVVATAINAAGDVLLQYDSARAWPAAARVLRADGVELVIGPTFGPTPIGGTAPLAQCCGIAAGLTEGRRALGVATTLGGVAPSVILDVARGRPVDGAPGGVLALNDRGQMAGAETVYAGYPSVVLRTYGFTAPALPKGHMLSICDRPQRFTRTYARALDDDANVLADHCGNMVLLPAGGGASVFLDRHVGRTDEVRLARRGGLVAGLDSSGAINLWRVGSARTTRVRLPDDRWRVEALGGVAGDGALAVTATDRATGRRNALRLTPEAR